MAWAGSARRSRPFYFRGCDLTAEWLPATEHVWVQFPPAAPIIRRAPAAQQSLQNSARVGQHHGGVPTIHGVVADKQCTCPASKLMWERYPPTPPIFNCGKLDQRTERSLINFFRWV